MVQPAWPARARASELVPAWRSTWLPSVATLQVPPEVVQPVELPSSKSSLNSVAAWALPPNAIRPATSAVAAAAANAARSARARPHGARGPGPAGRGVGHGDACLSADPRTAGVVVIDSG